MCIQSLSRIWLFATLWTAAGQDVLSFTISKSLLKFMSIVSMMPSNHLILCCPFFFCFQSFPAIRVFSNESALRIRWPKYSALVLPVNIQGWFPLGLTGLISLQSKGLSRVFSSTRTQKHQFFTAQPLLWSISHLQGGCLSETGMMTRSHQVAQIGKQMLRWKFVCRQFVGLLTGSRDTYGPGREAA